MELSQHNILTDNDMPTSAHTEASTQLKEYENNKEYIKIVKWTYEFKRETQLSDG